MTKKERPEEPLENVTNIEDDSENASQLQSEKMEKSMGNENEWELS